MNPIGGIPPLAYTACPQPAATPPLQPPPLVRLPAPAPAEHDYAAQSAGLIVGIVAVMCCLMGLCIAGVRWLDRHLWRRAERQVALEMAAAERR